MKPITCYKVLRMKEYNRKVNNVLISPLYVDYIWKGIGEENVADGEKDVCVTERLFGFPVSRRIEGGYFHTFAELGDALKDLSTATYSPMVLCECSIPVGAEYYSGKYRDGYSSSKSYASDKLVIERVLCSSSGAVFELGLDGNYYRPSPLFEW